jgi:NADPH-dependent ferric siderophore reductase
MKKKIAAAGAVGALAVVGIGAGAWVAFGSEDEVVERGSCAGTAYELTVDEDDNGLELDFELQSSGPLEVWVVQVSQGDTVVLEGERTTDDDGELDLDVAVDEDGAETFEVVATPESGEACTATVTR